MDAEVNRRAMQLVDQDALLSKLDNVKRIEAKHPDAEKPVVVRRSAFREAQQFPLQMFFHLAGQTAQEIDRVWKGIEATKSSDGRRIVALIPVRDSSGLTFSIEVRWSDEE